MIETRTPRLRLVAGTVAIAAAELEDRGRFAGLLRADVPSEWPPESLRDALPFFLELFKAHPQWSGWLGWYAISAETRPILCGSVGFKGPPNEEGMVEIGYSLLPAYQGVGLASEMVAGLVEWVRSHSTVAAIEAESTPDNLPSIRLLERNGFEHVGEGMEPGFVRYRRAIGARPSVLSSN